MNRVLVLAFVSFLCSSPLWAQQKAQLTAANAACNANNCLEQDVGPTVGGATLTLTGTWSGTVQFEASGDGGTTWVALNAVPSNSTTAATSSTGNGVWQVNLAGYTGVRMRVSSYSSGTAVASIIFSLASAKTNGAGGGGGGSGTVTSVATTAPITGGTCTTTCTIGFAAAFSALMDGATVTWATASVPVVNASLLFTTHGGSRTLNLTGLTSGGNYVLTLTQDGTGGEGLTLGTGCTWKVSGGGSGAITPSTGAGAIDVLAFTYDGTNCYANFNKNFN